MKRITMIKIHLYLSAIAAPFLIVMALTGTSYLLGIKGSEINHEVKTIALTTKELTEESIAKELKLIDESYSFEYIKKVGDGAITRPTTREYYKFSATQDGTKITHVTPSFLRRLIEVHKGHGPGIIKTYEKGIGIFLLLILISGLYLALTMKKEKKITIILFILGTFIFALI